MSQYETAFRDRDSPTVKELLAQGYEAYCGDCYRNHKVRPSLCGCGSDMIVDMKKGRVFDVEATQTHNPHPAD